MKVDELTEMLERLLEAGNPEDLASATEPVWCALMERPVHSWVGMTILRSPDPGAATDGADQPVAVDGRVEVRPVLPMTATIDHRYVDGWPVANAMTALRAYLAASERFEPALAPVAAGPVQAIG